jgi:RNA polymerase sigma-70 factor (family 1)
MDEPDGFDSDMRAVDASSFRHLFEDHASALRRYAHRLVRSHDAAEDIVQDAFIRLWRGWARVEIGANTRAYLFAITRSLALNHLARAQREAQVRDMSHPRGIASVEPALPPEGEARAVSDDIIRAIEQVLAAMPARQREVAALRLRHQLPTAEIARRLGISPRTVEVHIARATKALREQLPTLLPNQTPRRAST